MAHRRGKKKGKGKSKKRGGHSNSNSSNNQGGFRNNAGQGGGFGGNGFGGNGFGAQGGGNGFGGGFNNNNISVYSSATLSNEGWRLESSDALPRNTFGSVFTLSTVIPRADTL